MLPASNSVATTPLTTAVTAQYNAQYPTQSVVSHLPHTEPISQQMPTAVESPSSMRIPAGPDFHHHHHHHHNNNHHNHNHPTQMQQMQQMQQMNQQPSTPKKTKSGRKKKRTVAEMTQREIEAKRESWAKWYNNLSPNKRSRRRLYLRLHSQGYRGALLAHFTDSFASTDEVSKYVAENGGAEKIALSLGITDGSWKAGNSGEAGPGRRASTRSTRDSAVVASSAASSRRSSGAGAIGIRNVDSQDDDVEDDDGDEDNDDDDDDAPLRMSLPGSFGMNRLPQQQHQQHQHQYHHEPQIYQHAAPHPTLPFQHHSYHQHQYTNYSVPAGANDLMALTSAAAVAVAASSQGNGGGFYSPRVPPQHHSSLPYQRRVSLPLPHRSVLSKSDSSIQASVTSQADSRHSAVTLPFPTDKATPSASVSTTFPQSAAAAPRTIDAFGASSSSSPLSSRLRQQQQQHQQQQQSFEVNNSRDCGITNNSGGTIDSCGVQYQLGSSQSTSYSDSHPRQLSASSSAVAAASTATETATAAVISFSGSATAATTAVSPSSISVLANVAIATTSPEFDGAAAKVEEATPAGRLLTIPEHHDSASITSAASTLPPHETAVATVAAAASIPPAPRDSINDSNSDSEDHSSGFANIVSVSPHHQGQFPTPSQQQTLTLPPPPPPPPTPPMHSVYALQQQQQQQQQQKRYLAQSKQQQQQQQQQQPHDTQFARPQHTPSSSLLHSLPSPVQPQLPQRYQRHQNTLSSKLSLVSNTGNSTAIALPPHIQNQLITPPSSSFTSPLSPLNPMSQFTPATSTLPASTPAKRTAISELLNPVDKSASNDGNNSNAGNGHRVLQQQQQQQQQQRCKAKPAPRSVQCMPVSGAPPSRTPSHNLAATAAAPASSSASNEAHTTAATSTASAGPAPPKRAFSISFRNAARSVCGSGAESGSVPSSSTAGVTKLSDCWKEWTGLTRTEIERRQLLAEQLLESHQRKPAGAQQQQQQQAASDETLSVPEILPISNISSVASSRRSSNSTIDGSSKQAAPSIAGTVSSTASSRRSSSRHHGHIRNYESDLLHAVLENRREIDREQSVAFWDKRYEYICKTLAKDSDDEDTRSAARKLCNILVQLETSSSLTVPFTVTLARVLTSDSTDDGRSVKKLRMDTRESQQAASSATTTAATQAVY